MTQALGPEFLMPGSCVGPWRIEGWVGRGAYGVVFQATRADQPESEPVALKLAASPQDARFAREVELLRRIRHPSVPALVEHGVWETPGGQLHPYIAMQWVEGLSLYEWARVYNPPSRQVLQVVAQVAWALETLHKEGCLHRDVKGDNIKVRRDGRAFLMDFGSGTWAGAPRLTDGPMAPGTQCYRPPEALRFQWYYRRNCGTETYEAREADDVYSLGVSAYRVVTGRYPPPGTDPEMQLDPEREPPPPREPPQAVNVRVVPELAALIERMLAEVPQARPDARAVALAAQVAAELGGTEANVPLSPTKKQPQEPAPENKPASAPPSKGPQRRRRLLPMALCCLVGLWLGGRCRGSRGLMEEAAQMLDRDKPEAGTAGVGKAIAMVRPDPVSQPYGRNILGFELPPRPLPGQTKPSGDGGCPRKAQDTINGGCWIKLGKMKPPCRDEGYEWQDGCYRPVYESPPQPTSEGP